MAIICIFLANIGKENNYSQWYDLQKYNFLYTISVQLYTFFQHPLLYTYLYKTAYFTHKVKIS